MIAKAQSKYLRIAPYKLRLVAKLIRGKKAEEAIRLLPFLNKRGARIIEKVLKAAIANAMNTKEGSLHEEDLYIESIEINCGPTLDRFKPGPQGRVKPFKHHTSHIYISLGKSE